LLLGKRITWGHGKVLSWYLVVLKKYAVFSGRSRRKEYWMFCLCNWIITFALAFIEALAGIFPESGDSIFVSVYQFAIFLPTLALGIRRMHDSDHSGWWILLPIVNLVFACTEGTRGDNRFGSDPKEEPNARDQNETEGGTKSKEQDKPPPPEPFVGFQDIPKRDSQATKEAKQLSDGRDR
jgi:uncharacterized membrane protein YhaH (DUF805 family)